MDAPAAWGWRRTRAFFWSHSSANNAEAVTLRDWLIGHGWDDLFLDLDPERGSARAYAGSGAST
jgi:hypothetical protein